MVPGRRVNRDPMTSLPFPSNVEHGLRSRQSLCATYSITSSGRARSGPRSLGVGIVVRRSASRELRSQTLDRSQSSQLRQFIL